jgi:hypothetical protein
MDKNVWFSRRALKLHAVILIIVPAFMALCAWQISRAIGGNSLSWAYVFEWPIFAGYAVYMWWRFVHEATEVTAAAPSAAGIPESATTADGSAPTAAPEEDADLAAYNAYLGQLAERDQAAER